jgi:PAS domain S-box-containing protein
MVLEHLEDGVICVDADWRVSYLNSAAERLTGVSRDEALGRPCRSVLRSPLCEGACPLRRAAREGRTVRAEAVVAPSGGGGDLAVSISAVAVKDSSGRPAGGVEILRDVSEVSELRRELSGVLEFGDIVARSKPMRKLLAVLPRVADSGATVLLEGENGTGKEFVARALHSASPRRRKRFVAVSCTSLPDALLEVELFGRESGGGGRGRSRGRLHAARGGTLFLDEVAEVSPALQVRLLRVLQEGEYQPLGSSQTRRADVRLMVATTKSLESLVSAGRFRQDLFYRVNVARLRVPPLRRRREDIPLLVGRLVHRLNVREGRSVSAPDESAMGLLMNHDWPGNVRELESALEHAFVLCRQGAIRPEHLPEALRPEGEGPAPPPALDSLAELEAWAIRRALARSGGRRGRAARALGIDPSTLWRKMKRMERT